MPSSLSRSFVLVAFLALGLGAWRDAWAEPPRQGEVFVPCALRGRATMPLDTIITDIGGRPIARFSGAETMVTVAGLSTRAAAFECGDSSKPDDCQLRRRETFRSLPAASGSARVAA